MPEQEYVFQKKELLLLDGTFLHRQIQPIFYEQDEKHQSQEKVLYMENNPEDSDFFIAHFFEEFNQVAQELPEICIFIDDNSFCLIKFKTMAPVNCFIPETIDWSHGFEFNQTEGIVVDENTNFRQLLGYLVEFFKKMGYEKIRILRVIFHIQNLLLRLMFFILFIKNGLNLAVQECSVQK